MLYGIIYELGRLPRCLKITVKYIRSYPTELFLATYSTKKFFLPHFYANRCAFVKFPNTVFATPKRINQIDASPLTINIQPIVATKISDIVGLSGWRYGFRFVSCKQTKTHFSIPCSYHTKFFFKYMRH